MDEVDRTGAAGPGSRRGRFAAVTRAWMLLTGDEQWVVVIVLSLFLLGLTVRYLHDARGVATEPTAAAHTTGITGR